MSDELKPCPFCGAPGTLEYMPSRSAMYPYFVMCTHCANGFGGSETEKRAIKLWNKRADADTDALRAKCDAVPWDAIKRMLGDIGCAERANLNSTMDDFSDVLNWWIANAPQEAAE